MKIFAILALLISIVSCKSSPSKGEVVVSNLCMSMQKGMMNGMGKPFDEAKEKPMCDCYAKFIADKCCANCETEDGAAVFVLSPNQALRKEVSQKCK